MYTDYDHNVTCIDAHYMRPRTACFYLLRGREGAAVIETGTNYSVPHLFSLLDREGLHRNDVRYVIPTHVHLDHAGGTGLMMRELPQAQLIVHPRGAKHLVDPTRLIEGTKQVYGEEEMHRLYGDLIAVDSARVTQAPDGFRLNLGERELLFRDTPGHARHHFCIWDNNSRGWFSGDCFGVAYPELNRDSVPFVFPTTTPVQFDPDTLRNTLELLASQNPKWMYLTHFGRIPYLPQLKDALAQQIVDYVRLGQEVISQGGNDSDLAKRLADYTIARLRDHGNTGDESTLRERLALDMNLNAQGVMIALHKH